MQASQRALGAAVGALGLSNKAVFAEHAGQPNAGVGSGLEGGNYAEGPDLAPNAAPGAATGESSVSSHECSALTRLAI